MYRLRLSIIPIFYISITITTFSILCDARSFAQFFKPQDTKLHKSKSIHELEKNKLKAINHLDLHFALASPNIEFQPFDASSPFSSPPLDSPAPGHLPLPAPNSVSPPIPPNPSLANPPPSGPTSSPIPNPPQNGPSPHPPTTIPTPPKSVLSPPVLPPPIAFPPPSGPPSPPQKKPPQFAVWCVVKPTVPDPIIQEALDYACGSGADCKSIRPNGSCYQPNTLLSHASYAFNSYWQNTKIAGGTCDFGGTAMLVTVDPSYDECNFFFNG
ncbi:sulfated surface glycoprotein 185-like [Pyrus ussuriensis x Pyrus communis]|uniref:Sulfated surface glycoprotein 185-like n=1 Tax=Pyrus ussuriensis x Pyrus communis TaxID=2448454 RepID=A0A5N5G652_9ROSA|nr:sulfated surface glycoprotein 185-like [Pyrus ussuriensis x Pyrus communis]